MTENPLWWMFQPFETVCNVLILDLSSVLNNTALWWSRCQLFPYTHINVKHLKETHLKI